MNKILAEFILLSSFISVGVSTSKLVYADTAVKMVLGPALTKDGYFVGLNQDEAIKHCKTREGGHLPSAIEFARAVNKKGVRLSESDSSYKKIAPKNEKPFFYNYKTLTEMRDEDNGVAFWTASLSTETTLGADMVAYKIEGYNAKIDIEYKMVLGAVRCMIPQM